jgi:outer membrane protein assembly factor BamA
LAIIRNIGHPFCIVSLILIFGYNAHSQPCINIDSIRIEGNHRTKTEYLLHFIKSRSGQLTDSCSIAEDIRRLGNLAGVMHATAKLEKSDSLVILVYSIEERYTLLPVGDFGITDNNFRIGGGIMESNLAGRGLYVYGYYQYNPGNTVHLILRNPYLFGSRWGVEFQLKNLPTIETPGEGVRLTSNYFDVSIAARYEFRYENELLLGTSYRTSRQPQPP